MWIKTPNNWEWVSENQSFVDKAILSLEDNRLSEDEKDQLNLILLDKEIGADEIKNTSNSEISIIKSKIELKKILKDTNVYLEIKEEIDSLSKNEIKTIQSILGTPSDWYFWINTFLKYKNSPLSDLFTISELVNWRKVWKNPKKFIQDFSKLNWIDDEILAIVLANWIDENCFVCIDSIWSIIVYSEKWWTKEIAFSENNSLESLIHDSFTKNDIWLIIKQLDLLPNYTDKKNYIKILKKIIKLYWYYDEAREIFTKWNWKIKLEIPALNKYLTANDIFWDKKQLKSWNSIYINNWNWDFINKRNWKRLSIFNNKIITVVDGIIDTDNIKKESSSTEKLNDQIESTLTKEFGDWVSTEWLKFLGKTWKNSCWKWFSNLINKFLKTKWIKKALNINLNRHWANFDTILEWWKWISTNNPFIIWNWMKIESLNELKKIMNIENALNEKIVITKRKIDFPKNAKPWEVLVYNWWATANKTSRARRKYWHVEVKWSDWDYYSYYWWNEPWWSSKIPEKWDPKRYSRMTWFTWFAYGIKLKA